MDVYVNGICDGHGEMVDERGKVQVNDSKLLLLLLLLKIEGQERDAQSKI